MNNRFFALALMIIATVVAIQCCSSALASGRLRTVVLSGRSAPDRDGDAILSDFGVPVLNRGGYTSFIAEFSGPDVDRFNDTAILTDRGDTGLALVAVEGDSIPGGNANVHFLNLGEPLLNNKGQIAFFSQTLEEGAIDWGLFSEGGGDGLATLARNGDRALDTGEEFFGFGEPVFNDDGQLAFFATLRGPDVQSTNDASIFLADANHGFRLLAREGDPISDVNPEVRFGRGQFSFGDPVISTDGHTAFRSRLTDVSALASGVFGAIGEKGLETLLRTGDAIQSSNSKEPIEFVSDPTINRNGQVAFVAGFALLDSVLLRRDREGALTEVARSGDAVPGIDAAATLRGYSSPVLNSVGQTAFLAALAGPEVSSENDEAIIFGGNNGNLESVALEGKSAPGLPEGITFGGRAAFGRPTLNRNGQVAFQGWLNNGEHGIFAQDIDGSLTLIAHTGQAIDVSDNPTEPDFRIIRRLSFIVDSGNEDGRRSGFNDKGQLAFYASFTGGSSGIFVSNLVAIPEPSTALMAIVLFVWIHLTSASSTPSHKTARGPGSLNLGGNAVRGLDSR